MKNRIEDKINDLEEFLGFLSDNLPSEFEEYKKDKKAKAICERYAEKIIEAIVDLAFLTAKFLNLELPVQISDKEIFDVLSDKNIITKTLAIKLQEAKSMRNIIAHEYGKIDDKIVYEALSDELPKDTEDFINTIKILLKKGKI